MIQQFNVTLLFELNTDMKNLTVDPTSYTATMKSVLLLPFNFIVCTVLINATASILNE